jgi:hypothetical protein
MMIFLRHYRRAYSKRLLPALLLVPLTCLSAYGQGGAPEAQPIPQGWVKLTHKIGNAKKSVFIQVAQICLVSQSAGINAEYPTLIQLANGKDDYVSEGVLVVMKLIAEASKAQ